MVEEGRIATAILIQLKAGKEKKMRILKRSMKRANAKLVKINIDFKKSKLQNLTYIMIPLIFKVTKHTK